MTGRNGGTTVLTGAHTDCVDYEFDGWNCYCNIPDSRSNEATVNTVAINGERTVWWFNGQSPSGYATSVTLT